MNLFALTDGEMIALVGMLSTLAIAVTNMIGSVLMLLIRAKYKYPESSALQNGQNAIRDVPNTGR